MNRGPRGVVVQFSSRLHTHLHKRVGTMLLSDYELPWNPSRIYEEIGVRPRTKGTCFISFHFIDSFHRFISINGPGG